MDAELRIAEAGLELATAPTIARCCELLRSWILTITHADSASVTLHVRGVEYQFGTATTTGTTIALEAPHDRPRDWSGTLQLLEPRSDRWQDAVQMLTQQASLGITGALRNEDLSRHERQQRALVEAGKALSSERTLDGVLQRIIEHAVEITGARYGALGVLDADGERLERFITVGIDPEVHAQIGALPTGRGILGVLIDDPRPLRLKRLQDDPRSVGFPQHHPPMETFLGVPIVSSTHVAGRIYLCEKPDGTAFTAEDEELVQTLASQAAISIDNASLNDLLQTTAAELREASSHKSAFLANMSHELRSPLNTIIGYTKLLLEEPRALDEEQLEDLEIVLGSGEHLLSLITDLLDLQRIEAGRTQLDVVEQDLAVVLDAVVASVRPALHPGVTMTADAEQLANPSLRADRTRLRQILLNLVGNAAKFTQSGSITITAQDTNEDDIVIEIRDTGPGIPDTDQQRIFESFFQSQAALERTPGPHEGAGLGLAIARTLVEMHGGRITLESELGAGTCLRVTLPRSGPDEQTTP